MKKVDSGQWTVVRKKDVGTQNETRENIMLTYNDQTKARFPLSLDGRGARGEGVALPGKAGLLLATCLLYLAPAPAALAQNECGDPTANGGTADSFTCPTGDQSATGFTHEADGDLELIVPDSTNVGANGIVTTTGPGAENLTLTADTDGLDITGSDGAVIDYTSDTGAIDIHVDDVVATGSATHNIRANSTSGAISIVVDQGLGGADVAAIEAITGGGDILLDVRDLRAPVGVIAETSGDGTVTLNESFASFARAPDQVTTENGDMLLNGVWGTFTSQTGDITVNPDGNSSNQVDGGTVITTETGGLATINLAADTIYTPWGDEVGTAVQSSGAGDVVVTVAGDPDFDLYRGLDQPGAHLVSGKDNDFGELGSIVAAPFDFSNLGGSATVTFEHGSGWFLADPDTLESGDPHLGPRNTFSDGDDVVHILSGAVMATPTANIGTSQDHGFTTGLGGTHGDQLQAGPAEQLRYVADFGAGEDVLHMAGDLFVSMLNNFSNRADELDALGYFEMRLENLETFNHAGTIWLGALSGNLGFTNTSDFSGLTDGRTDDILSLPGAHFVGELDGDGRPLGRIRADMKLGRLGQTAGCGIEFRDLNTKHLPVADCIDLRDGHASGKTLFIVNQTVPGDRGAYNPEGSVLVDVSGDNADQTDPDAFGIAPESQHYGELNDGTGVVDKGLFFYTVNYDPANEQYRLYGLPGSATQQFPLLRQAANSLWRASTNAWFDRQVDQRDVDLGAGQSNNLGSGVWGRATVGSVERDLITPIEAGETIEFDNSHTLDEDTITVGWDLISRDGAGGSWLIGGMLGHTRGSLRFDASPNVAKLRGMHAGLYASVTQGGFYLDGAFNATRLDVDNDVPSMRLTPETAQLETDAESIGARVEAGYRLNFGPVGIEPLAGLSWVKTKLDDIDVPADDPNRFGGTVQFKYSTNNSANAGLRLSMEDLLPNVAPTGISLTVRGIEEINGRAEVTVDNLGPIPAVSSDTLEGSFTQVTGSVNVTNPSKTLAGYINVDVLTGDDYDSNSVSAGVRYQW